MAWTGGVTLATGDLVTEAMWNNYMGAAGSIQFLHDSPACRVHDAGDQSVADVATLALLWDTEDFDTDTIHAGVNTSRLTCTTAGVYLIVGNVIWDAVTPTDVDTAYLQTWIRQGGAAVLASVRAYPTAAASYAQCVTTIAELAATNYVELCVKPNYIDEANATIDLSSHFEMSFLRGPTT